MRGPAGDDAGCMRPCPIAERSKNRRLASRPDLLLAGRPSITSLEFDPQAVARPLQCAMHHLADKLLVLVTERELCSSPHRALRVQRSSGWGGVHQLSGSMLFLAEVILPGEIHSLLMARPEFKTPIVHIQTPYRPISADKLAGTSSNPGRSPAGRRGRVWITLPELAREAVFARLQRAAGTLPAR